MGGFGGFGGLGGFGGFGGAVGGVGITATQAMQPVEDKSCEILMSIGDVRGEVKDASGTVKDSIANSNTQRMAADLSLHNRLCEAEKAAIEGKWAGISATKDVHTALSHQLEMCCCDIKLQNVENRAHINEKFCETNRNIDDKVAFLERRLDKEFDEIRTREFKAENAALRYQLNDCRIRENNSAIAEVVRRELECAGLLLPTPIPVPLHK